MNQVAFHFNVPEPLPYACHLLRQNLADGVCTAVIAKAQTLQQLDEALWCFSSTDFLAHCLADAKPSFVAMSPIVLVAANMPWPAHCLAALNLGDAPVAHTGQLNHLIEVVSLDETDRQLARQRWKHYSALGLHITKHDCQAQSQSESTFRHAPSNA